MTAVLATLVAVGFVAGWVYVAHLFRRTTIAYPAPAQPDYNRAALRERQAQQAIYRQAWESWGGRCPHCAAEADQELVDVRQVVTRVETYFRLTRPAPYVEPAMDAEAAAQTNAAFADIVEHWKEEAK